MQTDQESNTFSPDSPFPFGKYKGVPLAVVMADANYMQWLEQQAWMGEKYPNIVDYFRNGPAKEDSCTPDHNAMQIRYLDEEYCKKLAMYLIGDHSPTCDEEIYSATFRGAAVDVVKSGDCWMKYNSDGSAGQVTPESVQKTPHECGKELAVAVSGAQFEWQRWDVMFSCAIRCSSGHGTSAKVVALELKPSISEDYPSILRKVKERVVATYETSRRRGYGYVDLDVVVTDSYTGKSATLEQVKKMFAASNITFLLSSEFEGGAA